MPRFERRFEVDDGSFAEHRLNFVLALIVGTVISAASVYVLSGALLCPDSSGPVHRMAAVTWHAQRAGFVVMKRPAEIGAAALGRGFEG